MKHVFKLALEFDGTAKGLRRNLHLIVPEVSGLFHVHGMDAGVKAFGPQEGGDGQFEYDFEFVESDEVNCLAGLESGELREIAEIMEQETHK